MCLSFGELVVGRNVPFSRGFVVGPSVRWLVVGSCVTF
jgi:hypothetical protein